MSCRLRIVQRDLHLNKGATCVETQTSYKATQTSARWSSKFSPRPDCHSQLASRFHSQIIYVGKVSLTAFICKHKGASLGSNKFCPFYNRPVKGFAQLLV